MSAEWGIRILDPPQLANEWLVEFDPDVSATDPPSYPTGNGRSSRVPAEAMRFDSGGEAWEFYRQISKAVPLRPDGKPNRPLTTFTVAIEKIPA